MNFKLSIGFFQKSPHYRLLLKRQKILFGKLYSSSESSSKDSELVEKSTELTEKSVDSDLVKREPETRKSVVAEINPRLTRIDRREILQVQKPSETERRLALKASQIFDVTAEEGKTKETFSRAVGIYTEVEAVYRRGHVEFINEGLKRLEYYGLEKDLDAYRILLSAFPQEELVGTKPWQIEFMHYPKQQQCAIDLMEKMQNYGLIPDDNFGMQLKEIFGEESYAFRKFRRILYWLPKFKYADPYPVPHILPTDPIALAVIALKRMAFDVKNKIKIWKTIEVEESPIEDTFIVSAQSPKQKELIEEHPADVPLYVEGAYTVWLRKKSQSYFVLRADPKPGFKGPEDEEDDDENLFENWRLFFEDENPTDLQPVRSCHEQEDSTVLAMCITGTGSQDSLLTWIRYLQKTNPKLEQIPVVFRLQDPDAFLQDTENKMTEDKQQGDEEIKKLEAS